MSDGVVFLLSLFNAVACCCNIRYDKISFTANRKVLIVNFRICLLVRQHRNEKKKLRREQRKMIEFIFFSNYSICSMRHTYRKKKKEKKRKVMMKGYPLFYFILFFRPAYFTMILIATVVSV